MGGQGRGRGGGGCGRDRIWEIRDYEKIREMLTEILINNNDYCINILTLSLPI